MQTILLVEDDQFYREAFAQLLGQSGYTVIQAKDGQEGLDKLEQQQFDLIISDIMHPTLDGLQMVERFNASGKGQGEIWFLSNLATHKEVMQEAQKLGVAHLFDKSLVSPEEMLKKVNAKLNNSDSSIEEGIQASLLGESDMLQYLTQFDHIKLVPEKRYLFIITDDTRRKDYASAYIDARADITNNLEEGIRMLNPEVYKLIYSDQELKDNDDYVFWEQRDFIYIYESQEYRGLRIEKEEKRKDKTAEKMQDQKEEKGLIEKVIGLFKLP